MGHEAIQRLDHDKSGIEQHADGKGGAEIGRGVAVPVAVMVAMRMIMIVPMIVSVIVCVVQRASPFRLLPRLSQREN